MSIADLINAIQSLSNAVEGANNHDERCVARLENPDARLLVSTVRVNDGDHPYETAIAHPEYNRGAMVIVEAYDTREEAAAGHERWVAAMTAPTLPESLADCRNSYISQLVFDGPEEGVYVRHPEA